MMAKLRHMSHEPQHALPDVFLWLLQNNKRVAYHRIPAKELIYSPNDEEAGKNCATVQTLFLKVNTHLDVTCNKKDDITLPVHRCKVNVLRSNITFLIFCCFSYVMSS